MPRFVSARYFDLLRNYRRHGWLVLYLFGVSPVVCKSFLKGREHSLRDFTADTAYEPYGTSLRMSDIGYRNRNQADLTVSVNSLDEYIRDLGRAITTPYPPYAALGVKVDGGYQQLNANILQIENEYYSFIRPKRVARSGERPTKALRRAGVEYVEVRALDVSAFDPVGVNQNKLRFLEAFLALCLLKDSPLIGAEEQRSLDENHLAVARRGRRAGAHPAGGTGATCRCGIGRGSYRLPGGHLRDSRPWRCLPALLGGARRPGGQGGGRAADAIGQDDEGAHRYRRALLRSGAAHVGDPQGVLPRSLPAERGAPAGIRGGGAGVARAASGPSRPPTRVRSTSSWPDTSRIESGASCGRSTEMGIAAARRLADS